MRNKVSPHRAANPIMASKHVLPSNNVIYQNVAKSSSRPHLSQNAPGMSITPINNIENK
jgi:hypothetical protein